MRRRLVIVSMALAALACTVRPAMHSEDSFDSVTYRGEVIKLKRFYTDFHDYRDDPDNLPAQELARVARLVRSAPIASEYLTRKDANDAVFKLMFPGYGLSMFQLHEPVALYSIEVPRMDEDRLLVFAQEGGRWILVDDFLWPQSAGYVQSASYLNGRLQYRDRQGKALREK